MSSKLQKTQAIVLRRTNYGEADRILQLLTPEGKRSVMAKSVRKEKSRLAGGIELFAICNVVITEGKGDLGTLTSARLDYFFKNIMHDYDRMQFGYVVIKLVNNASEMVNGSEWFDVLAEVLGGLDSSSINLNIVQTWFYIRYASLMGYELSLWHDIMGDKIVAENNYHYDVVEKGLSIQKNGELTADHIKLLRLIATRQLKVIAQIGGVNDYMSVCLFTAREHASI